MYNKSTTFGNPLPKSACHPTTHDLRETQNSGIPEEASYFASNPAKTPQTQAELERLEISINNLDALITSLGIRLAPILEDSAKSPAEDCPRPYLVPVANAIYTLNERIVSHNDRLQSILNCIEI